MTPQIRSVADSSYLVSGEKRAILSVTCLAGFLFFNSFGSILYLAFDLLKKAGPQTRQEMLKGIGASFRKDQFDAINRARLRLIEDDTEEENASRSSSSPPRCGRKELPASRNRFRENLYATPSPWSVGQKKRKRRR